MATRSVFAILFACALVACAGRCDDGPSPAPVPVESCWALCRDCGRPHWVWTCDGHPPSAPTGCAWTDGYAGPVLRCSAELGAATPAGCVLSDLTTTGEYDYACGAVSK